MAIWPEPLPLAGQQLAKVNFTADSKEQNKFTVAEEERPEFTDDIAEANVSTSKVIGSDKHKILLDIDLPCKLIESSTPGHFHLYIDHEIELYQLKSLLFTLANIGVIEEGYAGASVARGYTSLRLPWVKKEEDPNPGNEAVSDGFGAPGPILAVVDPASGGFVPAVANAQPRPGRTITNDPDPSPKICGVSDFGEDHPF